MPGPCAGCGSPRSRSTSARSARRAPPAAGSSVVASHDLLLAALCDHWARPEGLVGEIAFKGSLESLGALARGDADVVGFHAGTQAGGDATAALRQLLDSRRDVLIRFAEREQGLMVKRGNPKRLRSLGDVAAKDARFVNRQRGSGTRLLIDQLLSDAQTSRPTSIRGYETEEFTHLAVAATVAAGRADAAFGLKAAASRFGLDFVPVRRELYWLALRSRRLESEAVQALCRGIAGEPLRRAARGLAGYSIRGAGHRDAGRSRARMTVPRDAVPTPNTAAPSPSQAGFRFDAPLKRGLVRL